MSSFWLRLAAPWVAAILFCGSTSSIALAASAPAPAPGNVGPTFIVPQTVIWAGRSAVIPFQLTAPAPEDKTYEANVEPAGVVEVIRQPAVLKGQTTGFLRIRSLKLGECALSIGDSKLQVRVSNDAYSAPNDDDRPRLVGPAVGAAVWGRFAVGVEINDLDELGTASKVHIELPGGKKLEPIDAEGTVTGPLRRYVFEVDTAGMREGVLSLTAVAADAQGNATRSNPLRLLCIAPDAASISANECEATLDTPRPDNYGKNRPKLGSDPAASGGTYVTNYGTEPVWVFPFDVPTQGLYQVMVVARGDAGAGALPSVGLAVDGEDRSTTAARLVDVRWRRVPVGTPVTLKAGKHVLGVKFINDFYAPNYADRNLYLDRYEIVRVDTAGAEADAGAKGHGDAGMQAVSADASQPKMTATPMTSGATMTSMMGDLYAGRDGALRVAFWRPIEGLPLRGDVTIQGYVWWPNPKETLPPRTALLINGEPVMDQWAQDPTFKVSAGFFKAGINTVQLVTTADGRTSASTVQHITVPADAVKDAPKRDFHRFGMTDPAWGDTVKEQLKPPDWPPGQRTADFWSNGQAVLDVPENMTGKYDVVLETKGDEFRGPPIVAVSLRAGGKEQPDKPIGEVKATKNWNDAKVGTVDLPAGKKQIVVAFTNDLYEKDKGDRNVYYRALSLRTPVPGNDDHAPPHVKLLYPAAGLEAYSADAVVAQAWDNDALAWVDVVIDGKQQGCYADLESGLGRIVIPLLLRSLPPGEHRIKLRARDRADNMAESEEVTIKVLDHAPAQLTKYDRAVRLLNRFAFGPEPEELADVLTMGEEAWLSERLSRRSDNPSEMSINDKVLALYPNDQDYGGVSQRVLHHLQTTQDPARARFVLWAENHFNTWLRKTEPPRKWREHERFAQLGAAPFGDLLLASATSPAMLAYLDQQRSIAGQLNENYAREIMELHTLGVHAGYTQADVTALAGVLNGWTFSEEAGLDGTAFPLYSTFRYDPSLSDGRARQVFGMAFDTAKTEDRYDRVRQALEMLAARPETARFICTKLVEHYVAVPAPDAIVNDLANVFMQSGGDMKTVMLAMAAHSAFWDPNLPLKVARPIDYVIRLCRTTRSEDTWAAQQFLDRSGMGMFDCVTPNGYPEQDERYADSNALLQRWRLANGHRWRLSTLVPGPWRQPASNDPDGWKEKVVDVIAVRLTGRVLSDASRQAAVEVLDKAQGDNGDRMMQAAAFVGSLPEASLR